jgi:hypothetical protein
MIVSLQGSFYVHDPYYSRAMVKSIGMRLAAITDQRLLIFRNITPAVMSNTHSRSIQNL